MKLPDQIWVKYWRLTIASLANIESKKKYYLCKCDCWKDHIVNQDNLRSWVVKSCWCLKIEKSRISTTHWMRNTRIYNIFFWTKQRCNNINCNNYKNYWGSGIKCEWNTFEEFYRDMWDSYKEWLSIDRIDNNWNYSKDNCRWSDRYEQVRNRRNTLKFNWISLADICSENKLPYNTIYSRIHTYWFSLEKAITQKIKYQKDCIG